MSGMTHRDPFLLEVAYAELLSAARAAVAAADAGDPDPLILLRHALARRRLLPPAGAAPSRLLAEPLLGVARRIQPEPAPAVEGVPTR
jgi:hypothetical protein